MNKRTSIIALTVVAAFALLGLVFANVQAATLPSQIFQFTQTIAPAEVSNLDEFTVTLTVAPPYSAALGPSQVFTITNPLQNMIVYELVAKSDNVTYSNDAIIWNGTVGVDSAAQSAWFVLKIKETYLVETPKEIGNVAYVSMNEQFWGSLPVGSLPGVLPVGTEPGALPYGGIGQAEVMYTVLPTDDDVVVDVDPTIDNTLVYTTPTDFDYSFTIPAGATDKNIKLRYIPIPALPNLPANFRGVNFFNLSAFLDIEYQPGFVFAKPVTMNFEYTDASVKGLREETLRLYYWDELTQQWDDVANTCTPASTYVRDLENNKLSVNICHLTNFAMAAKEARTMYMPLVSR